MCCLAKYRFNLKFVQKFCHVLADMRSSSYPEAAQGQERLGTVDHKRFGRSGRPEVAAFPGQGDSQGDSSFKRFSVKPYDVEKPFCVVAHILCKYMYTYTCPVSPWLHPALFLERNPNVLPFLEKDSG